MGAERERTPALVMTAVDRPPSPRDHARGRESRDAPDSSLSDAALPPAKCDGANAPPSPYARIIERFAAGQDPARVERWLRVEHGSMDSIASIYFAREVKLAAAGVRQAGIEQANLERPESTHGQPTNRDLAARWPPRRAHG